MNVPTLVYKYAMRFAVDHQLHVRMWAHDTDILQPQRYSAAGCCERLRQMSSRPDVSTMSMAICGQGHDDANDTSVPMSGTRAQLYTMYGAVWNLTRCVGELGASWDVQARFPSR